MPSIASPGGDGSGGSGPPAYTQFPLSAHRTPYGGGALSGQLRRPGPMAVNLKQFRPPATGGEVSLLSSLAARQSQG